MSENNNKNNQQKDVNNQRKDSNNRSPSPNPFLNYLSSSPKNISPRSDTTSASVSPRSPRFANQNGISIGNPLNGASITNAMLTAG